MIHVARFCHGALVALFLLTASVSAYDEYEDSYYRLVSDDGIHYTIAKFKWSIANLALPDSHNGRHITAIGERAFYGNTTLTNIILSGSITHIGKEAFMGTLLQSVSFGHNLTYIGSNAFMSVNSLQNLVLPNSLRMIDEYAFTSTGITNVQFGTGITNIANGAFVDTKIKHIRIPDSVTYVGEGAFASSALTNIVFSANMTEITAGMLQMITNLSTITIPATITNVGNLAFSDSTQLERIYFKGNAPPHGSSVFINTATNALVYYMPNTTGWSNIYAGLPTVFWNPRFTTIGPRPAGNKWLGIKIDGTPNIRYTIEHSTNLLTNSWIPVAAFEGLTMPVGGTTLLPDNDPDRFKAFRITPY